jgi:heat shock protein HslJ
MSALAALAASGVAACGGGDEAPTPPATTEAAAPASATAAPQNISGLSGTSWRLVEFQSMDDAQGTTRPDDPSLYTMTLNADGTASLRLNCNRATGTWTAEPSADATNGRFEFGPLAATMAVCPPPSMDELVSRQAAYIRGYMLRDGKLYLTLMADGGIFAWEPHEGGS